MCFRKSQRNPIPCLEQTTIYKSRWGGSGMGDSRIVWGWEMQTITFRMDKQWGPAV